MKKLKFVDELVPLILNGSKDTTWRLFDDKDLHINDELSLVHAEMKEEFAKGKIISVKETTFNNLTAEDLDGHEKFLSKEVMLQTYSKYYKKDVTGETILKIIKFQVLKD